MNSTTRVSELSLLAANKWQNVQRRKITQTRLYQGNAVQVRNAKADASDPVFFLLLFKNYQNYSPVDPLAIVL